MLWLGVFMAVGVPRAACEPPVARVPAS